jgi:hypothetical protein
MCAMYSALFIYPLTEPLCSLHSALLYPSLLFSMYTQVIFAGVFIGFIQNAADMFMLNVSHVNYAAGDLILYFKHVL